MSARATRDVPSDEPINLEIMEQIALCYQKGVECMAELQIRALECAVQHNQGAMEIWKQAAERLPWASRLNMFDSIGGTMERIAGVQKTAINLAVDQTRIFTEMVRERATAAGKTADAATKFAQQSFERSLTAQRKVAEAAVAETKTVYENVRGGFAVPGGEAVAETIRKGVDTVIDAQKELLEAAARRWATEPETVAAS